MAYSIERKHAALKRLPPPINMTIAELSQKEGIIDSMKSAINWVSLFADLSTGLFTEPVGKSIFYGYYALNRLMLTKY